MPSLAYEGRRDQLSAADDVALTLAAPRWRGPEFDKAEHIDRLQEGLEDVYGDWFAHDDACYRHNATLYAKVAVDDPDDLPHFEAFLARHVESWRRAAITYAFRDDVVGRANALFYERRDNKPVHPDARRLDLTDAEQEAQFERWNSYSRDGDPPRYEFRPAYAVDGDYGTDGLDVVVWSQTEFDLDLRIGVTPASGSGRDGTPTTTSPAAREFVATGDRLREAIPEYARHIEVTPLDRPFVAPGSAEAR